MARAIEALSSRRQRSRRVGYPAKSVRSQSLSAWPILLNDGDEDSGCAGSCSKKPIDLDPTYLDALKNIDRLDIRACPLHRYPRRTSGEPDRRAVIDPESERAYACPFTGEPKAQPDDALRNTSRAGRCPVGFGACCVGASWGSPTHVQQVWKIRGLDRPPKSFSHSAITATRSHIAQSGDHFFNAPGTTRPRSLPTPS